ncbi:MAG: hypothetical protein MZU97_07835 [Bacillus subtilis]|nr:hypothetical protein [Bacillus subtilis]
MIRLDPGEGRIKTARSFRVWEGGGEYNVTRRIEALLRDGNRGRHRPGRQRRRLPPAGPRFPRRGGRCAM